MEPALSGLYLAVIHFFYPFWVPESLQVYFREVIAAQRAKLTVSTTGWSSRHWEELSKQLFKSAPPASVSDVSSVLKHLRMEAPAGGYVFTIFCAPDGSSGQASPIPGCLSLAPAAISQAIDQATASVDRAVRDEKETKRAQVAAQLVRREQDLAESRKAGFETEFASLTGRWDSARQRVEQGVAARSAAANEIAGLKATVDQQRLELAGLIQRCEQQVQSLQVRQEERRIIAERVLTPGRAALPDEKERLEKLDQYCSNELAGIYGLEHRAIELEKKIAASVESLGKRKRLAAENEARITAALAEVEAVRLSVRQFAGKLDEPAGFNAEKRRLRSIITAESLASFRIEEQLGALHLWHLAEAGKVPSKVAMLARIDKLSSSIAKSAAEWSQNR